MVSQINSIISNLLTVFQGLDGSGSETAGLRFHAGEIIEALVLSKKGDTYLLQTGGNKFLARAETHLQAGELVRLAVLGSKDDTVLLKNLPVMPKEEAERAAADRVLQLIKKYGVTQEKEIAQVRESLSRIPGEENTSVRYLLDPYLLAALLIPNKERDKTYQKIELSRYNSATDKKRVWEVCMDLNMTELGRLEITVRMVENSLYLRVWAESAHIETLLRLKKEELTAMCFQVEIVPALQGPLFKSEPHREIDLTV